MAQEQLHEAASAMSEATHDMHRAIASLIEELEAIDWYQQRADACGDAELGAVIAHNRDEEKEHAAMLLEWIRRRDPTFSRELQAYLFTDAALGHDLAGAAAQPAPARQADLQTDLVDEAGRESFPASDAPCWTP